MNLTVDLRIANCPDEPDGGIGNNENDYTDTVEGVLYANAAILVDFVENERGGIEKVEDVSWLVKLDSSKDIMNSNLIQANQDLEIARLYRWWKERRVDLLLKKEKYLSLWSHFKKINGDDFIKNLNMPDTPDSKEAWEKLNDIEQIYEMECDDFLNGIIRVRRSLWT